MKPLTRILFSKAIEGQNVHEWATVEDTIIREGNTAYLCSYLHPNEKYGAQTALVIISPEEIQMIEKQ
jgi:flavorubredoxin